MFKTPSLKSATSAAVSIGAGVVGAKVSDGVVAILPDSLGNYKKPLVAVVALVAAASINAKDVPSQAAQAACIGMGIKQGMDAATELLVPVIAAKDNSTTVGRFLNAVVGHNALPSMSEARYALNSAAWQPNVREQFQPIEAKQFAGM